ncbi:MAG: hypothetical protein P1V18_04745 [Candidatus Gracilibacteria bacterium]|nr:hypothetical protein [Candidatus Gracilibacteria bacterium]
MKTPPSSPDPNITQKIRRPQSHSNFSPRIVVEKDIELNIKSVCEEQDVIYIPDVPLLKTEKEKQSLVYFDAIRKMIQQLFAERDQKTGKHLDKVGKYAEFLLNAETFKTQMQSILEEEYSDQPFRKTELSRISEPKTIEKIKLGLHLHDIGKLQQEIIDLINAPRKLTHEEKLTTMRHTAVRKILDELSIFDPIIRQIALFHHAPSYWGADPYRDDTLSLPTQAIAFWDKKEDKEADRENYFLQITDTQQPITLPYAHEYLPLHVIISEEIDIFDAMTEPRPYRQHEPFWFRQQRRGSRKINTARSHYSVQDELLKRCSHDRKGKIAHLILTVLQENWENGAMLKENIAA